MLTDLAALRRPAGARPLLQGVEGGRHLRWADRAFDLALCSHFLFTYSDQLSMDFHVAAIEEMCRVAREARVFPLLESYGGTSLFLEPVISALRQRGFAIQTRLVPYEFQRGGNQMLVVSTVGANRGFAPTT